MIWLTGLPGAGKSTIAQELTDQIDAQIVDGDVIRKNVCTDVPHGKINRKDYLTRVIEYIIKLLKENEFVIVAIVSPEKTWREWTKVQLEQTGITYYEIYVEASLETCERRDVKGLYDRYHAGEDIKLAGLTEAYEKPENPLIVCNTETKTVPECVEQILETLDSILYTQFWCKRT